METQKWTFRISSAFTILALGGAALSHYYGLEFLSNILIGIFASALLVAVSAAVSYISLKRRNKARIQYGFRQIEHTTSQYKLYLRLSQPQLVRDLSKLSDIVLHAYNVSFELNKLFVELSINEAALIDKSVFGRIISVKEEITAFAINITQNPNDWKTLIQGQIDFIDCANREIDEFLKVSKFIGKQKEVANDD
ncbi:hypothetical protein [Pygmaiobacter massiliensis]|uniref:hypothetical protein n=1 Tax=Pygmaiobacter massiliensis TaxID=1917873 RepID=UPI002A7F39DB|nr:hypothetical protein [Pygmaiobacter massiliensis]MDY4785095.1 hypothetical protein [Pygmaiobacter massiliensis]